jgi:hypothetical protein
VPPLFEELGEEYIAEGAVEFQTIAISRDSKLADGDPCLSVHIGLFCECIDLPLMNDHHGRSTNKIGMTTNIFLAPHNVNFHWVEDIEDEVMCTATGVYACNNNTGHGPKTTPSDYTTHVVHGFGTRGVDNDTVTSGFCDGGTTQGDGRISLRIPNRWRVKGTSTWRNYLPANQACSSTAAGELRASKAGTATTRQFSSAGSNYPP